MLELPFSTLALHLQQYRSAADKAFSRRLASSTTCRRYFFQLLVASSTVYQDFLSTLLALPELYRRADRKAAGEHIHSDVKREVAYRRRYNARLDAMPFSKFTPSGLAELSFGWHLSYYSEAVGIHVPEMYEESFRLEAGLQRLAGALTSACLTYLELDYRHFSEDHCTFLLPVLQELSIENNWKD